MFFAVFLTKNNRPQNGRFRDDAGQTMNNRSFLAQRCLVYFQRDALYKLGNRSALEWALDQLNERDPEDGIIAVSSNTYRFATFKEQVIDLIGRMTRLSVKTDDITEQMRTTQR